MRSKLSAAIAAGLVLLGGVALTVATPVPAQAATKDKKPAEPKTAKAADKAADKAKTKTN